jgi:glutamate dehydrogenase
MAELSKAIARLMQERERTQTPAVPAAEPPKLRVVLETVRDAVAPAERALAEAFVRQFFDKVDPDWLAAESPAALAACALATFRFASEPLVQEPRVVVFDPHLIHEGWPAPCTVIQTLMRDRPFIVDTVREGLRQAGIAVQRLLHPILAVERDARGALRAFGGPGAHGRRESLLHVEVERVSDPDVVVEALTRRLTDVALATDDYAAMRAQAGEAAAQLRSQLLPPPWNADRDEVAAFLDWLGDQHFVFLGFREYQFSRQGAERRAAVRRGSGLGILRREQASSCFTPQPLPEALRRRLNEPPLLMVSKTNAESPIHRRGHMEYVGIKQIDAAGMVAGERRFLGLFTSKAYSEEAATVPLLRRKLEAILAAEEAVADSHDFKAIVAAFNSIPLIELLATTVADLRAEVAAIRAAADAPAATDGADAVRVLCRGDALGRGVFVAVLLARERFSDDLYRRIGSRLQRALSAAALLDQHLAIDEGAQARLHFYLAATPETAAGVSPEALRAEVGALLRTWDDRLRDEIAAQFPRAQAHRLAARYTAAFPDAYRAATDVALALRDIRCLEALHATRAPQVDLANDGRGGDPRCTALTLYLAGEELVLSDFLPVLENLGLRVRSEDALEVALPEVGAVRLHTFYVQDAAGAPLDVDAATPHLQTALLLLHAGRIENDRLNALVLSAGLDWRQVDLLRTYVNHGVQIGTAASRGALVQALAAAPQSARLLCEYFAAKFDPRTATAPRDRLARTLPEIAQHFLASLDAVQSAVDDRILRALFDAVAATVRTTYFRLRADEVSVAGVSAERLALAVKIDSPRVAHLPSPHPACEIYVHAPHVEAVHLRSAKVARGGIRLSDRPDDFRAEILELMKTQTVKNAVIVPAGAKGGFIVKSGGGQRPTPAQVEAAYRTFISVLLDLTDNIVHGRVVPPANTLAYDDPDPYLVVAADKGTATFSDLANAVATEHGFWLGDAFASGGRHGYDHKQEGITARGAWECVRRHFHEMGRDAGREPVTVIGIGDMSGDVFGNGLLLSRWLLLRAAFDRQHIFLDPTPDAARAFAERERLFHLPRSSWADYDRSLISEGGGVFLRAAKSVPLSPQARALLGIEAAAASGEEVVRAILRVEADLLWNGGVGTYVKASDESHAAVGDSANDGVRIDAAALRVNAVAEGGNLGFTQRARVEYALRGGRINTDFIDNSAGVDMSDHEVNLKIALAPAVAAGELPLDERNRLLTELAPEVARRVLGHNRRQARALSLDQLRSQTRVDDFRELMAQLEHAGVLDRQLEALPDRDALRNRRGAFLGFTRPELAVLLARSKLALQQRLLAATLPDDPFFERYLHGYFPEVIATRAAQGVRSHRLRREIIAVEITNALVDTMGAAFVARVHRDTGADAVAVVRAWAIGVALGGAAALWAEIDGAEPPLPLPAEARCYQALEAALERATKWIVETQPADQPATALYDVLAPPTAELPRALPVGLRAAAEAQRASAVDALAAAGTPRALAERIVPLDRLAESFEITHLAAELDAPQARTAEAYYRASEIADIDWVWQNLHALPADGRWDRRAVEGLREGLVYARRRLTRSIMRCRAGGGEMDACVRDYVAAHAPQLARLRRVIDDIKSARRPTLAALLVVMHEIGRLSAMEAPDPQA